MGVNTFFKTIYFKIKVTLLALTFVTLTSCEKFSMEGRIDPYLKELYLYADYTNINNSPLIKIDTVNTSEAISLKSDFSSDAEIVGNRINLYLRNVRFVNELGTYQVFDIQKEVDQDGEWQADEENFLTQKSSKSLAFVLVLDLSSSLEDVNAVKSYATNFIDIIKSNRPNDTTEIGVVGFAQSIVDTFFLSTDASAAKDFIWGLNPIDPDGTMLYESMYIGSQLLTNSAAEGKALITFTDGKSNSHTDPQYSTPDIVINQLNQPTANSVYISSFTIGLKGKSQIEEEKLKALAMNGGLYAFPSSNADLEKVFNKFATTVSAVYDLVYNTNPSPIVDPVHLRYKIKVQLF